MWLIFKINYRLWIVLHFSKHIASFNKITYSPILKQKHKGKSTKYTLSKSTNWDWHNALLIKRFWWIMKPCEGQNKTVLDIWCYAEVPGSALDLIRKLALYHALAMLPCWCLVDVMCMFIILVKHSVLMCANYHWAQSAPEADENITHVAGIWS